MADATLADQIKAALATVEIPGGGNLGSYDGLSEIIVTSGAVAFAITVAPGMQAAFGPVRERAQAVAQASQPPRSAWPAGSGHRRFAAARGYA